MTQDDTTLAGYFQVHDRPPAYQGSDGHPYTVSVETEKTADLHAPYAGYLVFPRWAQSGVGIVGHVETPTVVRAASAAEANERLGELTLYDVQDLLEAAIHRDAEGEVPDDGDRPSASADDDRRGAAPEDDPGHHG